MLAGFEHGGRVDERIFRRCVGGRVTRFAQSMIYHHYNSRNISIYINRFWCHNVHGFIALQTAPQVISFRL